MGGEWQENMNGRKCYKTVFFDWHQTLSRSLFWDQLKEPDHPRHDWHARLEQCLMKENGPLLQGWMHGRADAKEVIDRLSEQCRYPSVTVFGDLVESCCNMRFVSDEIVPLIQQLRDKGVRCIIATDNMDTFGKYVVPALRLGELFDGILVSSERGTLKFEVTDNAIPFFDDYLTENGLGYNDVVLLDDHTDPTGTYERLGFDIIQISRPEDFVEKLRDLVD